MFATKMRVDGLGAVVRQMWAHERVSPPELNDLDTWQWINRSDVAFSLVKYLASDPRLMALAACALAGPVLEYVGGTTLELHRCNELVAYGLEEERWVDTCGRYAQERAGDLQRRGITEHGPNPPPGWQDHAHAAVSNIATAINMHRGGAPQASFTGMLSEGVQASWRALREKHIAIDGLPYPTASKFANHQMLRRLRMLIPSPSVFNATSVARRWRDQ